MRAGLGTSVLHHVDSSESLPALDARIKELQANGKKALVITALHPTIRLLDHLSDVDGVDANAVGIIDCTGDAASGGTDKPGDNILFVESPTMMESILVRVDRIIKRMGTDTVVIVHTLDAFALYSSRSMVLEFANQLVNNLRPRGIDAELLCVCTDASDDIVKKMESLVDVTLDTARS